MNLKAQTFRFQHYRVAEGLPSDFTKDIAEDSLGFIWIATDYGFVQLDGNRANVYDLPLENRFTKKFLTTLKGELIAIGDQNLVAINSVADTAWLTSLARGTHTPTDTSIWYPKTIFEDRHQNYWLAEPQAVSRFANNQIKRYPFPPEDRTTVFVRSFNFFESPKGDLFAISYPGNLFRYNPSSDRFEKLGIRLPANVNIATVYAGKLWLGAEKGLYVSEFSDSVVTAPRLAFATPMVSALLPDANTLWVGTFKGNLFRFSMEPGQLPLQPSVSLRFDVINNLYKSKAGDYWLATDRGAVLMQPTMVHEIPVSSGKFVEAVAQDAERGIIYYAEKEALYRLQPEGKDWQNRVLLSRPLGYFQGLAANDGKLWAANAFSLLHFNNDKLVTSWDLSDEGQFIHELWLDRSDRLWFCQDGTDSVSMIDKDLIRTKYHVPIKPGSNVVAVREGVGGIYAISNNRAAYLFLKTHQSEAFKDISVAVPFSEARDIGLADLATLGESVWLASAQGLLRFNGKTLERMDLGSRYTHHAVKVVEVLDEEHLLFGNAFGLFRYHIGTGQFWLYDENTGMPSNTLTSRGILVDENKDWWAGTSNGLAFATSVISNGKNPRPAISEVRVNGVRVQQQPVLAVPYHGFVSLLVTAPIFPKGMMQLEWRRSGGRDAWKSVEQFEINLSDLPTGNLTLEIRAIKTGYLPGNSIHIAMEVAKPFWKTAWFIALVIVGVLFIALITMWITQRIQKKRQQLLQQLIDERTVELNLRNQELDRFVYSASHDLSAPLRSILGLINVARLDNPPAKQQQYLGFMEQSVHKLQGFINEVVSYSRNIRMPVKNEEIHFRSFVESVLEDHRFTPGFENIRVTVEDHTQTTVMLDPLRLRIVLNNLLSNAIKFHWHGSARELYIKVVLSGTARELHISVTDNGRGIDQKHLDNLFNMFYRANSDTPGSGLGLYILKEAVAKMSGHVSVESKVGEGTTFTVVVPNQADSKTPAQPRVAVRS